MPLWWGEMGPEGGGGGIPERSQAKEGSRFDLSRIYALDFAHCQTEVTNSLISRSIQSFGR